MIKGNEFVNKLMRYSNNSAIRSTIKCCTDRGRLYRAIPYLQDVGFAEANPYERSVIALLASFLMKKDYKPCNMSFGETCRLAALDSSNKLNPTFEKTFSSILDNNIDFAVKRLSTLLRLIQSKGISINYVRLFDDLIYMQIDECGVKMNWGIYFWKRGDK